MTGKEVFREFRRKSNGYNAFLSHDTLPALTVRTDDAYPILYYLNF